jgi:hypothetical protein
LRRRIRQRAGLGGETLPFTGIEIEKRDKSQDRPPSYPRPPIQEPADEALAGSCGIRFTTRVLPPSALAQGDSDVPRAMRDELINSPGLRVQNLDVLFISLRIGDGDFFSA